jgi:small-conductance mechanosensitive channel
MVRECVERNGATRFDRCHFARFGAFSLDFETVYYVLSADFNMHMDIQQEIYFAIHEAFERAQIQFAYPTQKLWMAGQDGADAQPVVVRGLNGASKSPGAA